MNEHLPSIDRLKRQAKMLIRLVRNGDDILAKKLIDGLPPEYHKMEKEDFQLKDAHLFLARELGFSSWGSLMRKYNVSDQE